jgi:hypothetical protein
VKENTMSGNDMGGQAATEAWNRLPYDHIVHMPVCPTADDMRRAIAPLIEEIDALRKFKAYVHKRLDDAGIPADPDSPHKAEGCRVGGRLDIVLAAKK